MNNQPNRRRQRNGWVKVGKPVGSNVAEGRPVGVIEENGVGVLANDDEQLHNDILSFQNISLISSRASSTIIGFLAKTSSRHQNRDIEQQT